MWSDDEGQQGNDEFAAWLRTQFTDLESAKRWAQHWYHDLEQRLPEWGEFSMRAMAAHMSAALEFADHGAKSTAIGTWYIDTKYGPALYWAMMDKPNAQ